MPTVTDLATVAAATAAGYNLRQFVRAALNGATERVAIFSKRMTGESGTTGAYVLEATGTDLSSATTARTNALASLNGNRRHRYAGHPGQPSGATTTTWPDGAATAPVVDQS